MGYLAKLNVFNQSWEVARADIVYHRDIDYRSGKPISELMGGYMHLTIPSSERDGILAQWMLHKDEATRCELTEGSLDFYKDAFDNPIAFNYEFQDAFLMYYWEGFSSQFEAPMLLHIVISPAIQRFRGQLHVKLWHVSPLPPKEPVPYQAVVEEIVAEDPLKIISLDGPFDIQTGEKQTKGISRFKDYHYIVELNQPVTNTFDIYWGQSLDSSTDIKALLNPAGRALRGGHTSDNEPKKVRVTLRFGQGNETFKVHAYLNNRHQESTAVTVKYNKVVGIVAGVYNDIHDIELYEVADTADIPHSSVVTDTQNHLGGEANDAYQLFYDIKGPTGIVLDGIGGAGTGMKNTGGSIRLGTQAKTFSPKYYPEAFEDLDGFRGNQYTKVHQLTKVGRAFGKVSNVGSIVIGAFDIGINYEKEGGFGKETQQATGSFAGGVAGSALGTYIGGVIGSLFGGVGAIPGGIIGAIIGGYFGGEGGEAAVEYIQKD